MIIHLARASARRANVDSLLATQGLAAKVLEATDARAMDDTARAALFRPNLFAPRYPFALNAAEIACFQSHRRTWEAIAAQDAPVLTLEDDAQLGAGFDAALTLAQRASADHGVVQLQTRPCDGPALDHEGPAQLYHPTITPVRATAQLITPEAARHLLSHAALFDRPVDTFIQCHWHTGLRPAVIYPSGVSEIGGTIGGSTIQPKGARSLRQTLSREWGRFSYRRALARASRRSPA